MHYKYITFQYVSVNNFYCSVFREGGQVFAPIIVVLGKEEAVSQNDVPPGFEESIMSIVVPFSLYAINNNAQESL